MEVRTGADEENEHDESESRGTTAKTGSADAADEEDWLGWLKRTVGVEYGGCANSDEGGLEAGEPPGQNAAEEDPGKHQAPELASPPGGDAGAGGPIGGATGAEDNADAADTEDVADAASTVDAADTAGTTDPLGGEPLITLALTPKCGVPGGGALPPRSSASAASLRPRPPKAPPPRHLLTKQVPPLPVVPIKHTPLGAKRDHRAAQAGAGPKGDSGHDEKREDADAKKRRGSPGESETLAEVKSKSGGAPPPSDAKCEDAGGQRRGLSDEAAETLAEVKSKSSGAPPPRDVIGLRTSKAAVNKPMLQAFYKSLCNYITTTTITTTTATTTPTKDECAVPPDRAAQTSGAVHSSRACAGAAVGGAAEAGRAVAPASSHVAWSSTAPSAANGGLCGRGPLRRTGVVVPPRTAVNPPGGAVPATGSTAVIGKTISSPASASLAAAPRYSDLLASAQQRTAAAAENAPAPQNPAAPPGLRIRDDPEASELLTKFASKYKLSDDVAYRLNRLSDDDLKTVLGISSQRLSKNVTKDAGVMVIERIGKLKSAKDPGGPKKGDSENEECPPKQANDHKGSWGSWDGWWSRQGWDAWGTNSSWDSTSYQKPGTQAGRAHRHDGDRRSARDHRSRERRSRSRRGRRARSSSVSRRSSRSRRSRRRRRSPSCHSSRSPTRDRSEGRAASRSRSRSRPSGRRSQAARRSMTATIAKQKILERMEKTETPSGTGARAAAGLAHGGREAQQQRSSDPGVNARGHLAFPSAEKVESLPRGDAPQDTPVAAAPTPGELVPSPAPDGTKEQGVWDWLMRLDGGRGALLQYFDALKREFDADFSQITAARLPEPIAPGALGSIEPSFFDALDVKLIGHRLLLAQGVLALG